MKVLILNELTEIGVCNNFLVSIKPYVLKIRSQFYDFAEKLSPVVKATVLNHFHERINRAGETIMLGEYTPFIFGDLFSISKKTIESIAFPWFLIYEETLLLDDLTDKERVNYQKELQVKELLALKNFSFLKTLKNDIYKYYVQYKNQTLEAMLYEIELSKDATNYSNQEMDRVIIQGRKAALVKFCIAYMIEVDKSRKLTVKEEKILDKICAGIQLLDDLTDFMEDYKEKKENLLLSVAKRWIKTHFSKIDLCALSRNQLIAAVVFSNSVNTTLDFASNNINSISELSNPNNSGSIEYFTKLALNCHSKSLELDNIRKSLLYKEHEIAEMIFKNKIYRNSILEWNNLLDFFRSLPQMSN
jgi:hypothetical protein